jgi:hypothetical protein
MVSRQPLASRSSLQTLTGQSTLGLARATHGADRAAAGGVSGGGAGGDSDAIYDEVLRRLRQEQEQLGRLINHPF